MRVFWTVWRLLCFPGHAEGPPAVWSAAICLGDEAPPSLDRYQYRYVSKKDLLCRKRRENICFCVFLDCLEAVLLPRARCGPPPVWSAALYLGDEAPPALDRYRYRYVSKKYLLCRKKARKISFVSKKCVKTSNPCFDVEFCADHFIVWGPHAYFDGFRSKNIFLCRKKSRKYLFGRKKVSSRIIHLSA